MQRAHGVASVGPSGSGLFAAMQCPVAREALLSVDRFLKQRAGNIVCEGSYMLHRWYDPQGKLRTLACRTARVSPFRMIVDVPVVGRVGAASPPFFTNFAEL